MSESSKYDLLARAFPESPAELFEPIVDTEPAQPLRTAVEIALQKLDAESDSWPALTGPVFVTPQEITNIVDWEHGGYHLDD